MKRLCPLFFIYFLALMFAGCLTSSDDGGTDNSDETDTLAKKLSFPVPSIKLIEDYQIDLELTIDPPGEGDEWIMWAFAWPESTISFHTNADKQHSLNAWSFKDGDLTLTATLYDSLEVIKYGELAQTYGSADIDISTRRIIVDITAEQGTSYLEYTFTTITPHQDYLWPPIMYEWDFGDNLTLEQEKANTVTHVYAESGTYTVSVTLSAMLEKDTEHWTRIAGDTDTLLVQRPVTEDLKLVITPADTIWNTASPITLQAQPSLDWTEYPGDVRWMIDYGDGESDEFDHYLDDRQITHQYQSNGTYTLYIALHDPVTNDLLAQDSATITISDLPFILQTNHLTASIDVFAVRHFGTLSATDVFTQSSEESKRYTFGGGTANPLIWNGRSCSSEYSFTTGTQTTTDTITATVSEDGSTMEQFEYVHSFIDTDYQGKEWTRITRMVLEQVPLVVTGTYKYEYTHEGMLAGSYVTHLEDWNKILDPENGSSVYNFVDSMDWSNSSKGEPDITVEFERR